MKGKITELELSPYGEYHLNFLIDSEEDLKLFLLEHWKGKRFELKAVSNFRLYKLDQNKMNFLTFSKLYEENKANALEKLFQHKVLQDDIDNLGEILDKYRITLYDMYIDHLGDRKKSLLTWLSTAKNKKSQQTNNSI